MIRYSYYSILVIFVLCTGCHNGASTAVSNKPKDVPVPTGRHGDTLAINEKAMIYCWPGSEKIERLKKEMGEENFYTAADDNAFYMSEPAKRLDSITAKDGVKCLHCNGDTIRTIMFIYTDGHREYVKPDTMASMMGIYLFDPAKDKQEADLTQVGEQYIQFFTR